jgi:putative transposase
MAQNRQTQRRPVRDRRKQDPIVEERLKAMASEYPKWGCPQLHEQLRRTGWVINHKRTERMYRELGLKLRRRRRRRLPVGVGQVLLQPIRPMQCWSLDFMHDTLLWGKPYRLLNVIDDYGREVLRVEIDFSLGAERVRRVLDQLFDLYGVPDFMRSDNGPEFRDGHFQQWIRSKGVTWEFIQPGKPAQNAYIERFNGTFRNELLDTHSFRSLDEARERIEDWIRIYNEKRTHRSLGKLPPSEFKLRWQHQQSPFKTGIA